MELNLRDSVVGEEIAQGAGVHEGGYSRGQILGMVGALRQQLKGCAQRYRMAAGDGFDAGVLEAIEGVELREDTRARAAYPSEKDVAYALEAAGGSRVLDAEDQAVMDLAVLAGSLMRAIREQAVAAYIDAAGERVCERVACAIATALPERPATRH